jgi:hypothetical protein
MFWYVLLSSFMVIVIIIVWGGNLQEDSCGLNPWFPLTFPFNPPIMQVGLGNRVSQNLRLCLIVFLINYSKWDEIPLIEKKHRFFLGKKPVFSCSMCIVCCQHDFRWCFLWIRWLKMLQDFPMFWGRNHGQFGICSLNPIYCCFGSQTGWWFGTFLYFHSVGNVITPTDEVHHFSEG